MAPELTPITRGTMVLAALTGDYGKPRPFVIVQSDEFNTAEQPSFSVIPCTSEIVSAPLFRLTIDPTPANGLRVVSQLMVDKLTVTPRSRIGAVIGRLEADEMIRVTRALAFWLGIG
jgi:mRNA interferase MazF